MWRRTKSETIFVPGADRVEIHLMRRIQGQALNPYFVLKFEGRNVWNDFWDIMITYKYLQCHLLGKLNPEIMSLILLGILHAVNISYTLSNVRKRNLDPLHSP